MTGKHPNSVSSLFDTRDHLLPGFAYGWRPESYWPAFDLRTRVLTTVKGEARRRAAETLIDEGELEAVEGPLVSEIVSERERDALGRLHPMLMGGEYLPDLEPHEIEIARTALRSVTGDVLSVRARFDRGRIRYRINDEYETEFRSEPEVSDKPLTLGQLIDLIDHAQEDGGIAIGFLDFNYANGATLRELEGFVTVSSAFYLELHDYYEARFRSWFAQREAEWRQALEEDEEEDNHRAGRHEGQE